MFGRRIPVVSPWRRKRAWCIHHDTDCQEQGRRADHDDAPIHCHSRVVQELLGPQNCKQGEPGDGFDEIARAI